MCIILNMKKCPRCNTEKELTEFYDRRNGIGNSPYCKPCHKDQTIERQRLFKRKSIEYKGNKCCYCGYSKYQGALQFHHLDPSKKDFSISKIKLTTWDERATRELDKCVLLCANCHMEVHAGVISLDSVTESTEAF